MKVPTAMALVQYPRGNVSALIQRSGDGFVVKYKDELFFGETIIKCFEQTDFEKDIDEMANGFDKWLKDQNPDKVSYSDKNILRADEAIASKSKPSIYTPRFEEDCMRYLVDRDPANYMEEFVKA